MSTTKPRITVTLERHTHEVLTRLSAASGESMSQIVAGFVDMSIPSLERVVVLLERARAAPEEVRVGLVAAIERAERDLIPGLMDNMAQGDMWLESMVAAAAPAEPPADAPAAQPAQAAPRVRKRESTPVPVTRGSGGGKTLGSGRRDGPV
jgi:hypothetical protein